MKNLRLLGVVLGVVSLGLLGACDDGSNEEGAGGTSSDDGGGNDDDQYVSVEDFPARYAAAFCAAQQFCCTDAGGEVDDTCEADVEAATAETIAAVLAEPNRTFSEVDATFCLLALEESEACEWQRAGVCSSGYVLPGTVAAGDACESPSECAPPDTGFSGCAELGGASEKSCRQFAYEANQGEECFGSDQQDAFAGDEGVVIECNTGLYCDEGVCVEEVIPDGECTDNRQCLEGYCLDGTCQVVRLGEACNLDNDAPPCELGTNCNDGTCEQRPLLPEFGGVHACSVDP